MINWRSLCGLLLLLGCGGAAPVEHHIEIDGQSGLHLVVTITPLRGENSATFTLTDASGAPTQDVELTVAPWMPSHGHGSSVPPRISPQTGGTWAVEELYFPMAGTWQLRTQVSGAHDDVLIPQVDVP